MNKEKLCEAFCQEIDVRKVPSGFAVRTPFGATTGDSIGFYIVPEREHGMYRIEDDGTSVPFLEAVGVNLSGGLRGDIFASLLDEYDLSYDPGIGEIRSGSLREADVPAMAIRFVAMMLRLQDLGLLHPETVATTFKEDATRAIDQTFTPKATVKHDDIISDDLKNYVVDSIIELAGKLPVAVYYGTSENRVNEAVILWMETRLVYKRAVQVLLLLERASPRGISERALGRAFNHLDAVAVFRDDERAALDKIGTYVDRATPMQH